MRQGRGLSVERVDPLLPRHQRAIIPLLSCAGSSTAGQAPAGERILNGGPPDQSGRSKC